MGYVDLNTLHNPADGTSPPATWGDTARDNDDYLYQQALGGEAAWTSYTPALTATTTNPTLGSSSNVFGHYRKAGRLVVVRAKIQFGTAGVAAGSGNYLISAPVAAESTTNVSRVGRYFLFDNSAGAVAFGHLVWSTTTTLLLEYPATWPSGAQTLVTNAAPWTWAASDLIQYELAYESAA